MSSTLCGEGFDLSNDEKSRLMIEALPWDWDPVHGVLVDTVNGRAAYETKYCDDESPPNLYKPRFMHLAWRVLNWAYDSPIAWGLADWWHETYNGSPEVQWSFPPEQAQSDWLDAVFRLMIEDGLIDGYKKP